MTQLSHSSRLERCVAIGTILCLIMMPSVVCQENNFFDSRDEFSSRFRFGDSRSPDPNTPDSNTPDSNTPDFNAPDFNFGNVNFDAFNSEPDCSGIAFCDVCRGTGNSDRRDDVECVLCSGARYPSPDGRSCIRRQGPSIPSNTVNLTSLVPSGPFSNSFFPTGTLPSSS